MPQGSSAVRPTNGLFTFVIVDVASLTLPLKKRQINKDIGLISYVWRQGPK